MRYELILMFSGPENPNPASVCGKNWQIPRYGDLLKSALVKNRQITLLFHTFELWWRPSHFGGQEPADYIPTAENGRVYLVCFVIIVVLLLVSTFYNIILLVLRAQPSYTMPRIDDEAMERLLDASDESELDDLDSDLSHL